MNNLSRHSEKIAEKAADQALSRYVNEFDPENINEEELENQPVETEDDVRSEVIKNEVEDIFNDIGEVRIRAGDKVRYRIKRNNELLCYKYHPYSWEELQKEFGAGSYTVAAQSGLKGRKMLKTQSLVIADSPKVEESPLSKTSDLSMEILRQIQETSKQETERRDRELKEERERIRQETKEREAKMQQEQEKSNNLMTTLIQGMFNKPQDNREIDSIKDEIKNSNNQLTTVLLAMVQMMNKPQETKTEDRVLDMMMRLEEKREAREREDRLERERREEKMRAETKEIMEKIVTAQQKEKDPFEYIKFYKEAVQEGFEHYKTIEEIAAEKADEKNSSNSDDGSITSSLIKNLAPLMTILAQNNQNRQIPPTPPAQFAPNPVIPDNRRMVRHTQERTPTHQIHERNQEKTGGRGTNSGSNRQNPGQSDVNVAQERNPAIIESDTAQELERLRRSVIDKIGPKLIGCLMEEKGPKSPQESAVVCSNYLIGEQINPVNAIKIFTVDDVLRICGEYGMTDNNYQGIENWLREFYDHFREEAGKAIREYSQSQVSNAA